MTFLVQPAKPIEITGAQWNLIPCCNIITFCLTKMDCKQKTKTTKKTEQHSRRR